MSIYKANESPYSHIDFISTGYPKLDKILGGGIPFRKLTEISGPFSVGKSTLAMSIVAEAQKIGAGVLWADTEYSWDSKYAKSLGVNDEEVSLCQARFAEDTLDEIEEWANEHKDSCVILDSVGGILPRAEAEKGADGKVIGGQAKLIATFCRKIIPILAINNIALVVLNHDFTDLMSGKLMTSGGAKLGYHKSIWLRLKKMNKRVMQGERQIGDVIEAEIRKNKLAATLKESTELTLIYGQGFDKQADLLDLALTKGVITRTGNTFFLKGEKLGMISKVRELVKDSDFSQRINDLLGTTND